MILKEKYLVNCTTVVRRGEYGSGFVGWKEKYHVKCTTVVRRGEYGSGFDWFQYLQL